ncbi:efflux RND transporter permease subunit [Niallia sp. 01092]|uniref:efflux RND transporter permease subunit n=1 Tax=unclassified Niallia TaxID=2837522 RepID=UPI003FD3A39D
MSWFTRWAFGNKAAVGLIAIILLITGAVSYFRLPMELLPSADQPFLSVVVLGEGMDTKSMEDQVTKPVENALDSIDGKVNIFSTTGDGYSSTEIHLDSKKDKKEAKREIEEALAALTLPNTVSKPHVVLLNTSMIPVSYVSVSFDNEVTQKNIEFAKEKIIPEFKDIDGVSSVQTYGTVPSHVSVQLDQTKLMKNHVSFEQVISILQGQNASYSIGEKVIDNKSINMKIVGTVDSLEKLKDVKINESTSFADIANIQLKKQENILTRVNGKDSLLLVISKDGNSNAVAVSDNAEKTAKSISKKYNDVDARVMITFADTVKSSVNSMMREVLLGAAFATIVIMLFLRNIRSTLITIVSIPLSLAITLFLLKMSGVTLNILTLGGVAVAVGRLVDDSIVVIENIFRKMQQEKFSVSMVIEATKEVGAAITSSTLTTVAVFLPMGLLGGSLQDFILPFALTITYSLLASLIVALTVVPLMSASLLKNAKLHEHKPSKRLEKIVNWSLNHKAIVLITAFVVFGGSVASYMLLPKGTVDNSKPEFASVLLTYSNETPIETVKSESIKLEKYILEQEGIKDVYLQLGNAEDAAQFGQVNSSTQSQLLVTFKDEKDISKFVKDMQKQKKNYPNASLEASESTLMGGSQTSITIDIVGEDSKKREDTAEMVEKEIADISGIEKLTSNQEDKKQVYSFEVKPGLGKVDQIAKSTSMLINSTPIGAVNIDGESTAVQLEPMYKINSEEDLKKLPITTEAGPKTLSDLVDISKQEEPVKLYHKDGDPYIRLTAVIDPEKVSVISDEINKKINGDGKSKGLKIPSDVKVLIGGASADQSSDFNDLFMTMLVSIGIVFIIMVITFKSIKAPIAILASLPLAAIGAIAGIIISRISVDVTALLGALMLIGIVVTNAIVLLDRVKHNEQTMTIRDAVVEAVLVRMRPILMTAIATISAMLPLLFKQAESMNLVSSSLAIVVIGGLAVATILTLIIIPVIYELLYFRKSKKQRMNKTDIVEKGNFRTEDV